MINGIHDDGMFISFINERVDVWVKFLESNVTHFFIK